MDRTSNTKYPRTSLITGLIFGASCTIFRAGARPKAPGARREPQATGNRQKIEAGFIIHFIFPKVCTAPKAIVLLPREVPRGPGHPQVWGPHRPESRGTPGIWVYRRCLRTQGQRVYSMRISASGPDIGLPGRILAGLLPGKHRDRPAGGSVSAFSR